MTWLTFGGVLAIVTNIYPGFKTDHSIPSICILTEYKSEKGPGYWKLNSVLIEKKDIQNKIHETIKGCRDDYSDPFKLWEIIKICAKAECQEKGKIKSKIEITKLKS